MKSNRFLFTAIALAGLAAALSMPALAIGHGAVLASCDTDFARFRGLRWESPLE